MQHPPVSYAPSEDLVYLEGVAEGLVKAHSKASHSPDVR